MLGQVVIHAQRVLDLLAVQFDADLHDLLAHRDARIRGEVLERSRVLGACDDHDRVVHCAVLLEGRHSLGHRRQLLPDGDIDAHQALALLVDDRVDGDGRLARLAVADDQLALTAPDRDEGVDRLDARLNGCVDRLPNDDARRDPLDRTSLGAVDSPLVIERFSEGVDHPPQESLADGHLDHPPGRLDQVAFRDRLGLTKDDDADRLLGQVQRQAHHAIRELEQLGSEGGIQSVHLGNAVTHLDDGADIATLRLLVELLDRVLDDADDFVGADGHRWSLRLWGRFGWSWRSSGWRRAASRGGVRGGRGRWHRSADRRPER